MSQTKALTILLFCASSSTSMSQSTRISLQSSLLVPTNANAKLEANFAWQHNHNPMDNNSNHHLPEWTSRISIDHYTEPELVIYWNNEPHSITMDLLNNSMLQDQSSQSLGEAEPFLWRHSMVWTVILSVAYLAVFVLGLIGNLSVLWVIFVVRRKSRHSMFATCNKVFNGLIGNLALADLLVIIFCLPASLLGSIFTPWILGRVVCKAVPYLQGVSVSASIYTLVAISIDRFYGIYYPFNNGFSQLVRRNVIASIWLLSFLITIPWILFFDLIKVGDFWMCLETWPGDRWRNTYFIVVNLGLQYLVPLSIIMVFYVLLFMKIARRRIPVLYEHESTADSVEHWNTRIVEKSKVRVLKMLVVIVSLFALSWLPLYIIIFRINFGQLDYEKSFEGKFLVGIVPVAQWLGASNSCVNPILYFFFNSKFRTYLKKAITRNLLCSSSMESTRHHVYTNHQQQQRAQHLAKNGKCNSLTNGHLPRASPTYLSAHHRPLSPANLNANSNTTLEYDATTMGGVANEWRTSSPAAMADQANPPPQTTTPKTKENQLTLDRHLSCDTTTNNVMHPYQNDIKWHHSVQREHAKHLNCYHYGIKSQKALLSVRLSRETPV